MPTRTLEERLAGDDPEPWIPEEAGDHIFGEIEEITTRQGDYEPYPVVTIITDAGEVLNVACWDTVAKSKLEELDPQVGDSIGFKFLGEKTSKNGKSTYKNWRVVLSRAEGETASVAAAPATGDEFAGDE